MRLFDEISIPYEEYFSAMELTPEEIKKRVDFAKEFENIIFYIFTLLSVMRKYNHMRIDFAVETLKNLYLDLVVLYVDIDEYLEDYIEKFALDIIETTLRHYNDEWYLSSDRSVLIAENEANSVFAHDDYTRAIKAGKTKKRWITERDDRVRETHMEVNGVTIPIKEPFVVGDSLLLYPKDQTYSPSAEQTANCRCTVKYF